MFSKRKRFVLTINDMREMRLEEGDHLKLINKIEFDQNAIFDGKNFDKLQLSYIFNKILSDVNSKDFLLIRYVSKDNIFRIKKAIGLRENELSGYLDYNLEDILPFKFDRLIVKGQIVKEHIGVFGVEEKIVDLIKNITMDLKFTFAYLTLFTSEALHYWNKSVEGRFYYFNFEHNIMEYFYFDKDVFEEYQIIDTEILGLDGCEIPSESVKLEMFTLLDDAHIESENIRTVPVYAIGDKAIVNIWNRIFCEKYGIEIEYRPFQVDDYQGV